MDINPQIVPAPSDHATLDHANGAVQTNGSMQSDAWNQLQSLTAARIALGRAGGSLPTHAVLGMKHAHARARDAVARPFSAAQWADGAGELCMSCLYLTSAAPDLTAYLQNPGWGRTLSQQSRAQLDASDHSSPASNPDIALIVTPGLSSLAVERHALPLLKALLPLLHHENWKLAPLTVVERGRVALQDEIGARLNARVALILIGERPGLASPDSLSAYLVWNPVPGTTDAMRNCVSNIRTEGLAPVRAATTLHSLLRAMFHKKLSGVALKDESPAFVDPIGEAALSKSQSSLERGAGLL